MADKSFDRTVINARERPLSSDINQAQSTLYRSMFDMWQQLVSPGGNFGGVQQTPFPKSYSGFIGQAFMPRPEDPVTGMRVVLKKGIGFLKDPTPIIVTNIGSVGSVDDRASYHPIILEDDLTITVPASHPALPRIDIIEVKIARRLADPSGRDIFDPGTGQFLPGSVNKTLTYAVDSNQLTVGSGASTLGIGYKTGTPAAVPVIPSTTAGYLRIGQVLVGAMETTIPESKILDEHPLLTPYGQFHVAATVSASSTVAPSPPFTIWRTSPPGVRLAVKQESLTGARFSLWVFLGRVADITWVVPQPRVGGNAASTSEILHAQVVNQVAGELTAVDVGGLNPVIASGDINVAIGQQYIMTEFISTRQAAGVTGVAGLPNPVLYDVDLIIQTMPGAGS